jgi:DNA polymerase-1
MNNNTVVIDVETHDPHLKNFGCGAIRGDGKALRMGLYDGEKTLITGEEGFEEGHIARQIIEDPRITKVFHNGVYDLDWIQNRYKIKVRGRCEDTMTRQYLLGAYDEHYDLDSCCLRMGVKGKNYEDTIDRWWKEHGGKGKAIENLIHIPTPIIDKYLTGDLEATGNLFDVQAGKLTEERLDKANDVEVRLYPLLMEMKGNGIGIDWNAREKLSDSLNERYEEGMKKLRRKYPYLTSLGAPTQLKKVWEEENIPMEYTESGRPSFKAEVLELCDHPVAQEIVHLRTINTALTKFVDGCIPDYSYNGRIYSTFYPALRDEGGTITGRFSSRDPNLQNISAREDKFGNEIRALFIPDPNYYLAAFDYKQIEYVLFIHYAIGLGSEEAREKIRQGMDYHAMTMEMMGWPLTKEGRHLAKNLNFGSIYGLGPRGFAIKFRQFIIESAKAMNMTVEQYARAKMAEYFNKVTFVKPTCNDMKKVCERRGYLRSVNGRKQRTPPDGRLYKIVNYEVQGGASDIIKNGLVAGWEAGVFDYLKMHICVHDENVFSVPPTKAGIEAAQEFGQLMSKATQLSIPIRVDKEVGTNWANVKEDFFNELCLRVS